MLGARRPSKPRLNARPRRPVAQEKTGRRFYRLPFCLSSFRRLHLLQRSLLTFGSQNHACWTDLTSRAHSRRGRCRSHSDRVNHPNQEARSGDSVSISCPLLAARSDSLRCVCAWDREAYLNRAPRRLQITCEGKSTRVISFQKPRQKRTCKTADSPLSESPAGAVLKLLCL
jgi:hypothetical protein